MFSKEDLKKARSAYKRAPGVARAAKDLGWDIVKTYRALAWLHIDTGKQSKSSKTGKIQRMIARGERNPYALAFKAKSSLATAYQALKKSEDSGRGRRRKG